MPASSEESGDESQQQSEDEISDVVMSSEEHSNEVLVPQARDAAASQAHGEASESEEDEAPKRSPARRLVD